MPQGGNAGAFVSVLNNVSALFPPAPLLTQSSDIPKDFQICAPDCRVKGEPFRRCLCLISVPLNSVVDIKFNKSKYMINISHALCSSVFSTQIAMISMISP